MPEDTKHSSKSHTEWNLALCRALETRQRQRAARSALASALQQQAEPDALGGEASNFADVMRPDAKVLEEYGLAADFEFVPLASQDDNTTMQVCAWDDTVRGSAVSGCINLRSTCNLNTLVEAKDVITPLCVYAVNRRCFETLRAAIREQPTLADTLDSVCDVFDNHDSVTFAASSPAANECIPLARKGATSFVNVHTSTYSAKRTAGEPRDLEIQRVEVSFHPRVGTKVFMAESLRVKNKLSGATSCFVMSNYVPRGPASTTPRTACHLFGFPCNLAGGSSHNLLASPPKGLPAHGQTVIAALAALRSLATRAAAAAQTSEVARAFEALRTDPYLAQARAASVRTHPGLRLVALDTPGGAKLCVLLTVVMDCHDMQVAQMHAQLAAPAAPDLKVGHNPFKIFRPQTTDHLATDIANIREVLDRMARMLESEMQEVRNIRSAQRRSTPQPPPDRQDSRQASSAWQSHLHVLNMSFLVEGIKVEGWTK